MSMSSEPLSNMSWQVEWPSLPLPVVVFTRASHLIDEENWGGLVPAHLEELAFTQGFCQRGQRLVAIDTFHTACNEPPCILHTKLKSVSQQFKSVSVQLQNTYLTHQWRPLDSSSVLPCCREMPGQTQRFQRGCSGAWAVTPSLTNHWRQWCQA